MSAIGSHRARKPVVHDDPKKETRKPEDGSKERESLCCVPFAAVGAAAKPDASPVPDGAAVYVVIPIDEGTECSKPSSREEEVSCIIDDGRRRWDHPDQREDDGECCDDLCID